MLRTITQSSFNLSRWQLRCAFIAALVLFSLSVVHAQSSVEGETIFRQKCAVCHIPGGKLGPALDGVTERRDPQWLARYIAQPEKMLTEKDPIVTELFAQYQIPMPNPNLNDAQVASVIAYLQQGVLAQPEASQTASSAAQPQVDVLDIEGNPATGESLFQGSIRFTNGAAPCIACHSVADLAPLGGGVLGPDLTDVFSRYGEKGLASIISATPYPTMQPIYQAHPLTPEEQAHLRVFFAEQVGKQARPHLGGVVLAIAFGCALFAAAMPLILRNRLQGVRRTLVEQAKEGANKS